MNRRVLLIIATASALLVAADAGAAPHQGAHAAKASSANTTVATGIYGALGKVLGPENGALVASGLVGGVRNVVKEYGHLLGHVGKTIGEYLDRVEHEADLATPGSAATDPR